MVLAIFWSHGTVSGTSCIFHFIAQTASFNIRYFLRPLNFETLRKYYPNKFINKEDGKRYFIYNTLFNLPEIYAIASMIDMYEKLDEYVTVEKEKVHLYLILWYKFIGQLFIFWHFKFLNV